LEASVPELMDLAKDNARESESENGPIDVFLAREGQLRIRTSNRINMQSRKDD
jgi:hypothetical protein